MSQRRALITGVTGQDGAYLARLLLDKGYRVSGLSDRSRSQPSTMAGLEWIGAAADVDVIDNDLGSLESLRTLIRDLRPDEIYNLASVSDLRASWEDPFSTARLNGMGPVNLLEAVRLEAPGARLCQASSAEMLGDGRLEGGPGLWPEPTSPYTSAKLMGHWMVGHFRHRYGLFACSATLFNHESPLRGLGFVTRKITDGAARIALGLETELRLGNLESRRDWGHASDVVQAMWRMLQHDEADDYVIATGQTHSIGDVVDIAFGRLGLDPRGHVHLDPGLIRAVEVDRPLGDASKAREVLGWRPAIAFEAMIQEMVDADVDRLKARSQG